MKKLLLSISNLSVSVADKTVLHDFNLDVPAGEVHAIMGPNGSGKSTLAAAAMGHPSYTVTSGSIRIKNKEITELTPDARARLGLFTAFQYPSAIPGVSVGNFIRKALESHGAVPKTFRQDLYARMSKLSLSRDFAARSVNDGFSGGEKKRLELVQMLSLEPSVVILDEIDSGLDIDGLSHIARIINEFRGADRAIIIITHYARVLKLVKPHTVHVMVGGQIVESGTMKVADRLEKDGYALYQTETA